MPRVNIAHQDVVRTGLNPTETVGNVTDQHETPFHPRILFRVRNAHATLAVNFTLRVQKAIDGLAITHRIISIPALATRYIGPPTEDYKTGADKVEFDVGTVDLNIAIVRVP